MGRQMAGRYTDSDSTLVVILGMHRSGTSALAGALPSIGAEMGNSLLSADHRNEKGYWEDQDIKSFNDGLLQNIDSRWDHISAVSEKDLRHLRAGGFDRTAVKILKNKISGFDIYGLKEPQITKLLPFWLEVFEQLGGNCQFVVSLRNPLSSAISLTKRDGLTRQHGYWLWFNHMVAAIQLADSHPMIVVGYDHLLMDPDAEIRRMADFLGLPVDADQRAFYCNDFLDRSLRHSQHSMDDLETDPDCPKYVKELYAFLFRQARSVVGGDPQELVAASQRFSLVERDLAKEALKFDSRLRKAHARIEARKRMRKSVRDVIEHLPGGQMVLERLTHKRQNQ